MRRIVSHGSRLLRALGPTAGSKRAGEPQCSSRCRQRVVGHTGSTATRPLTSTHRSFRRQARLGETWGQRRAVAAGRGAASGGRRRRRQGAAPWLHAAHPAGFATPITAAKGAGGPAGLGGTCLGGGAPSAGCREVRGARTQKVQVLLTRSRCSARGNSRHLGAPHEKPLLWTLSCWQAGTLSFSFELRAATADQRSLRCARQARQLCWRPLLARVQQLQEGRWWLTDPPPPPPAAAATAAAAPACRRQRFLPALPPGAAGMDVIVEFRVGLMALADGRLVADPRKGALRVCQVG